MQNRIDQATAARIAEAAKQCACGAHGAIMLHKRERTDLWGWEVWNKMPACGPCAVALLDQGWTTERGAE